MHSRTGKLRTVGRKAKVLGVMKTTHSLIVLFSSWFFLCASCLYVGERRNPRRRESSEQTDENSIGLQPEGLEVDLLKNIEGAARVNEIVKETRLPGKQQSFIKCFFKLNGGKKPEYSCDHSKDVVIKWHEENGRLMGTFATGLHCAKQRSVTEDMHNPWNKATRKWKHLTREKRRMVYRDDAGEEEAPGEAAEQTDEAAGAPEVSDEVTAGEDIAEETQVETPEVEEEVDNKEENEVPAGTAASDGDDDKGQKEASEDKTTGTEGSSEDKEIPGADEGGEEAEKQVSVVEKEEDQATDVEGEIIETTTPTAEANGNKTDDVDVDPYAPIEGVIEFEIDLSQILPLDKISDFVYGIGNIIYQAGDYILTLLLGDMKRRLRGARINERFDAKVEKLANNYGGDSAKALGIMEKRIHSQLGKSYEFEIIKLLKELRDGLEL